MTLEEILHSNLTDEQYAAVIDDSRNILCLACAGSGKSRTLAYKIAYLVSKGEAPESIIAFTFTEKAAENEMLIETVKQLPKKYRIVIHLFYFEDESVQGMSNRIKEICEKSKSELNDFGLKASMFIKDKKSPKVQIKKIMDFYNTI